MDKENPKPLDISLVQEAYKPKPLPPHERLGLGMSYTFGMTRADVYSSPPDMTPVVLVRLQKGVLSLGDVLHVLPTASGGLHVDHQNGSCEISKTGDVAYVYTAPSPPLLFRESQIGPARSDVFGKSYTQTSLEVEGSPEGVRVVLYGTLEASPKPVNQKRGSPLQFFLLEYDPQTPKTPIRHEIWARNKARDVLSTLKLKKDDSIEAVLYRHTFEVTLQSGEKELHQRHNLATIIKVERKSSAKRQTSTP